ncbi:MAG: hypothetical protein Q4E50_03005 [Tissierellia bacterium]|nr:hypothetical protein [Tissierellia bacterium]
MYKVELKIPSDPQFLQAIRLTTSSLANKIGFDIDEVEDLKVIISEIVTYVIPLNDEILIKFELYDDKIKFIVKVEKAFYDLDDLKDEAKMKRQILLYLADDIEFTDEEIIVVKNK